MKWSKEEIEFLIKFYPLNKTEDIIKYFPARTLSQIRKKSKRLHLKKIKNFYKKGDCSFLLEETNLAYYWIGFILADGNITKNYNLRINLSIKDEDHLKTFSELIHKDIKIKNKYCGVCLMDTKVISKLTQKFDIHHNKTHFPPNNIIFESLDENKFISLLIGYIDGDGRIVNQYKRKTSLITFQVHSSWINFLNLIVEKLTEICSVFTPSPKINKRGYAYLSITNTKIIRFLKQKCLNLKLPYMKRKWDLIDENLISKYEVANLRRELVIKFSNEGLTRRDISFKVGIGQPRISHILKQYHETLKHQDK